jgi:hypothetical protein
LYETFDAGFDMGNGGGKGFLMDYNVAKRRALNWGKKSVFI